MAGAKAYTVDKKEEIRQLSKGGDVVTLYRMFATTAGGTYFHIDVPEADLGKADKLLTDRAVALDAIK